LLEVSRPRALVLDIEGTITPLSFVHDVLFPYSRQRLPAFLRNRQGEREVPALVAEAARIAGIPTLDVEEVIRIFLNWSDEDRKLTPLKQLQSLIWKQGYLDGTLRSSVYPDVPPALDTWRAHGIDLYIYSSGAVEAQRLLLEYSDRGDLSGHFLGYFDTTIGPKVEVHSYLAIQAEITHSPQELLFLSDNPAEIRAAHGANWRAMLIERDAPAREHEPPPIRSFSDLSL
jgi:enolase-phosphatase E1